MRIDFGTVGIESKDGVRVPGRFRDARGGGGFEVSCSTTSGQIARGLQVLFFLAHEAHTLRFF
jgi:hypothetical protein